MPIYSDIQEGILRKAVFKGAVSTPKLSYQTAHGFTVGDVIRIEEVDGVFTFYKALADTETNSRIIGMVSEVLSADVFRYVENGYVLATDVFTFQKGLYYFLSDTEEGKITNVAPAKSVWVGYGTEKGFKVEFGNSMPKIKGVTFEIVHGNLYNGWAVKDLKNIAPAGWHVPTEDEIWDLLMELSGESSPDWNEAEIAGMLKEEGETYWTTPNTGATNETEFTMRGSGYRTPSSGYENILNVGVFWTSTTDSSGDNLTAVSFLYNSDALDLTRMVLDKNYGCSLRLIKDDSNNTGLMEGNNGILYPTIKIGNQVWMACNSAETKFRNGDVIPGPIYTNINWGLLSSSAYCIYDDDPLNSKKEELIILHNATEKIQGGAPGEYYHHTKEEIDTHVYEAPNDGKKYGRKNKAWEEIQESTTGLEDVGFEWNDVEPGTSQEWYITRKAAFDYSIESVVLESDDEMSEVQILINGVPVTFGSDDFVDIGIGSGDPNEFFPTTNNIVSEGDRVTILSSGTDGGSNTFLGGEIRRLRI